jgi:hypothetical protein
MNTEDALTVVIMAALYNAGTRLAMANRSLDYSSSVKTASQTLDGVAILLNQIPNHGNSTQLVASSSTIAFLKEKLANTVNIHHEVLEYQGALPTHC